MSDSRAIVTVQKTLQHPDMKKKFGLMLPKEVSADRFTEVVMMALRKNPELLEADRDTLYDSCLALARRGFLPDGKEAALIAFSTNIAPKGQPARYVKKVQDMPMVLGIIKELGKAGVPAYAVSVYDKDGIRFWNDDDGQHVEHTPVMFGDRGERVGAFAAGKLPNGRTYVEAMDMFDLERVALRSKQAYVDNSGKRSRGGIWRSDPERMEQKSCLHRLRKRIPVDLPPDDDPDFDPEVKLDDGLPATQPDPEPVQESSGAAEATAQPSTPQEEPKKKRRPTALRGVLEQMKEPLNEMRNAVEERVIEPVQQQESLFEGDII